MLNNFATLIFAAALLGTPARTETTESSLFNLTLTKVTIVVKDQDEALKFYIEVLGMEKITDLTRNGQRFVTVAPAGQKSVEIILAKADWYGTPERVGQGTTWVLDTNDFRKAHAVLVERGVKFIRPPEQAPHGMQAVFVDLYGNPFALIERPARRR